MGKYSYLRPLARAHARPADGGAKAEAIFHAWFCEACVPEAMVVAGARDPACPSARKLHFAPRHREAFAQQAPDNVGALLLQSNSRSLQ